MWAISRVVVLLPLVPVIATIGMCGRGRFGRGPARHRAQRPQLPLSRSLPEGQPCRGRGDRLRDRARRRHGKASATRLWSAEVRCVTRGAG